MQITNTKLNMWVQWLQELTAQETDSMMDLWGPEAQAARRQLLMQLVHDDPSHLTIRMMSAQPFNIELDNSAAEENAHA